MEHTASGESKKPVEQKDETAPQGTSQQAEAKNLAPADRDEGSLEHGELGGNFGNDSEHDTPGGDA